MMHPDHLPVPHGWQRFRHLAGRVLLSAPLRLVWTALAFALAQWALLRFLPSVGRLSNVTALGAFKNAALATLLLWGSVWLLEGKGLSAVGFSPKGAVGYFARGYLVGVGLLTAVTATLFVTGSYQVVGLGSGASLRGMASAALLFLLVAVFEEVFTRGILFRLLEQALGSWVALLLSAFLFGFSHSHNPGATWLSSLAIALEAGVLLGAAYIATRSLWLVIGVHAAWNFFEGPVFGARVSGVELPTLLQAHFPGPSWLTGGDFGPEAGLPAIVLGTALGVAFLVLAARRKQFFTPPWLKRLLSGRPKAVPEVAPQPGAAGPAAS